MEQNYVYEDADYEEGLTFKKVGYFFKKGWLRMLIYAAVLALVATAVFVPIKVFYKSEPVAETSIEFIYDGIEKGLNPIGGVLDTDNIISTTVLKNAVDQAGLNGTIKDISKLRASMRVEGVLTDEYVKLTEAAANGDKDAENKLRNYVMHSTRFNIDISDPDGLGLSDDKAKLLLNKVVSSYYEDFKTRYSVSNMFSGDLYVLSDNSLIEFTAIYDTYTASLKAIKSYLNENADAAANFVSTENNATFALLLSELNILENNYDLFNAYILSNNVWRDKVTAYDSLVANKTDIENRLKPLTDYRTELVNQIKEIKPNTSTSTSNGSTTTTVQYPPEYFVYQAKLDDANRQIMDYGVQLANIETRMKKLNPDYDGTDGTITGGSDMVPTDKSVIDNAVRQLKALENSTAEFVQKVNATVENYYDTTFISSSVRQVQPPVVTRRSIGLNLWIVYLAAVLGGLIIAGAVTGVKIGKASAAKKNACAYNPEQTAVEDGADEVKPQDKK